MSDDDIRERLQNVQARYAPHLMKIPNVVGVAIGFKRVGDVRTDQMALVVLVEEKLPVAQLEPEHRIPANIEGLPVDVQATGGQFTAG
jgi:hypothetical protein